MRCAFTPSNKVRVTSRPHPFHDGAIGLMSHRGSVAACGNIAEAASRLVDYYHSHGMDGLDLSSPAYALEQALRSWEGLRKGPLSA